MADLSLALPHVLSHEVVGWPSVDGRIITSLADGMAHVQAASLAAHGDDRHWFSDDPDDPGGATAWGITLGVAKAHGMLTKDDLRGIEPDKVEAIYRDGYWRFNGLVSQTLACKVMDLAVNMGAVVACHLLQDAINGLGGDVAEDGRYGPGTEAAANAAPSERLISQLCIEAADHYRAIVDKRPTSQKYLKGWLARAAEVPV